MHHREQLRGQQQEAALLHQHAASILVKSLIRNLLKSLIQTVLLLHKAHLALREVTVEEHAQHVLLKVPAVYRTAQVIRNTPNRGVQLRTLSVTVTVLVSSSGRIRRLRRHRGGQPLISYRF